MTDTPSPIQSASPHPALAKSWEWFEAHQTEMTYERREHIFLALAGLEVDLWKLDTGAEQGRDTSAAVVDTALSVTETGASATGSALTDLSETVGERQGGQPAPAEPRDYFKPVAGDGADQCRRCFIQRRHAGNPAACGPGWRQQGCFDPESEPTPALGDADRG